MYLKFLTRFLLYYCLIYIIAHYTDQITTLYNIPKDKNLIELLAINYIIWIYLIGAIIIGILGSNIIEKILNFLPDSN